MAVSLADPRGARERLLDAAEARLLAGGSRARVLDAVARDAGVSKGGLLYHFPSKAALVGGLVERMRDGLEGAQEELALADGAPGRWTRAYLGSTVDAAGAPADASATLLAAILACLGDSQRGLGELRDAFAAWQQRLEDDGLDPATATVVRLAADGLWLSQLLGLPTLDPALLRGVLARLEELTRP
jgi:AcrR family transcriptional regulator